MCWDRPCQALRHPWPRVRRARGTLRIVHRARIAALVGQIDAHPVRSGHRIAHLADDTLDPVTGFGAQTPGGTTQDGLGRQHVVGVSRKELCDRNNRRHKGIQPARHDRLQLADQTRSRHDHISRVVRRHRVRAVGGDGDLQVIERGELSARADRRSARRECRVCCAVRRSPQFRSGRSRRRRAWRRRRPHLLRRLEHQDHRSGQFLCTAQVSAAPSSIATWPSWPHACMMPGLADACARPEISWIGSASMSARSPTTGPRDRSPTIRRRRFRQSRCVRRFRVHEDSPRPVRPS